MEHSFNKAKVLKDNLLLIRKESPNFTIAHFELALSLNEACSIMFETTFEKSSEIVPLINEEKCKIVKTVVQNLRASLQSFITTIRAALELEQANIDKENSTTVTELSQDVEGPIEKLSSQGQTSLNLEAYSVDFEPTINITAKDITRQEKIDEEKINVDIQPEMHHIKSQSNDALNTLGNIETVKEVLKSHVNRGNLLNSIFLLYLQKFII